MRDKIITFGLDRVQNLQVLEETYQMEKGFDADTFFKYSIGITTGNGKPQKIVLECNELLSKYILSQPLHDSQEYLGEKHQKHQFSYFLLPSYELKMQILGFGHDVKVLAPVELQEEIKAIAQSVTKLYS